MSKAAERKKRSEDFLTSIGVPINSWLPIIEEDDDVTIRKTEEVAIRTMSLLMVAVKAEGLEQDILLEVIDKYSLMNDLTPKELEFINNLEPDQFDRTQFIWRYEAAWTLLWALGYVAELSQPTDICDVPSAVTFMQERSREEFISESKLRSKEKILDQTDLIFRYHWAVVEKRLNNRLIPENIDSSVVLERHYALNWLVNFGGADWDNVSTDT